MQVPSISMAKRSNYRERTKVLTPVQHPDSVPPAPICSACGAPKTAKVNGQRFPLADPRKLF
jgi:hypothetical protein